MMRVSSCASVLGVGAGTAKLTIDEHRAVDVQLNAAFAALAPVRAAYGAVKAAVNMLTASLRVELKKTHPGVHGSIRVAGSRA